MDEKLRRLMWYLNKYFMVPVFRAGLGWFIVNPLVGYIMVLKVKGRRSGLVRHAPVNYAIYNGSLYCLTGFGKSSDWYRNLLANPEVEVILPSSLLTGVASDVTGCKEAPMLIRQILINGGFAGFFLGFNPRSVTDEVLVDAAKDMRIVRIVPQSLQTGPADPGGKFWLVPCIVLPALFLAGGLLKRKK